MDEKVTSKLYAERAIKSLDRMFKIPDGYGTNTTREIVQDIISAAKSIIEGLNDKFPCRENSMIITKLDEAILWSKKRTYDRQSRVVEGTSRD